MAREHQERVTELFRKFDINRNGFIERDELQFVMSSIDPEKWTSDVVDAMIGEADADRDGMIDYSELFAWVFGDDPSEFATAINISAESIAWPFDDQLVQELTWARTKPKEVADILRARRGKYKGKDYFPDDDKKCIVTKEGWSVVEEAIAYLEEQAKAPIGGVGIYSTSGLAHAGEDHCADIGLTGTASHSSSDGTTGAERVRRYGAFAYFGECLWYGSEDSDARKVVLDLIVDDGVASRGHRHGVYEPRFEVVGTAFGPHKSFGRVVAMEFALDWREDKEAIGARILSGPLLPDAKEIEAAKARADTHWDRGCCPVCKEPIRGGKVMNIDAIGGEVHFDCFKCIKCSTHLKGVPFKVHDKSFYCSACHAEEHGDKCAACGKGITGPMVKCSLGVFHVDCLMCSQCSCKIGKNRFSTEGGVMTCSNCSSGMRGRGGRSPAGGRGGRSASPARAGGGAGRAAPAAGGRAARAKAKPAAKVSMGGARGATMGIAMDYASLM